MYFYFFHYVKFFTLIIFKPIKRCSIANRPLRFKVKTNGGEVIRRFKHANDDDIQEKITTTCIICVDNILKNI